jgi:hypothetical protein
MSDHFDGGQVSVACQAVADGGLCGLPSVEGYAFCSIHLKKVEKKAMRLRVAEVQEQVFSRVEQHVDSAVDQIIAIMNDETARTETRLKAATTVLQLVGADLAAPTAHREQEKVKERSALSAVLTSDDEGLLTIVAQIAPDKAEMLRSRALDVAAREIGAG